MQLSFKDMGDVRIVTVDELRIDACSAIAFKDMMRDLMEGAPPRVVLDLSQVAFIDSSGLGAVVASMKLSGEGRSFELAGLGAMVKKVFKLTRMDSVFVIHEDIDAALGGGLASAG